MGSGRDAGKELQPETVICLELLHAASLKCHASSLPLLAFYMLGLGETVQEISTRRGERRLCPQEFRLQTVLASSIVSC